MKDRVIDNKLTKYNQQPGEKVANPAFIVKHKTTVVIYAFIGLRPANDTERKETKTTRAIANFGESLFSDRNLGRIFIKYKNIAINIIGKMNGKTTSIITCFACNNNFGSVPVRHFSRMNKPIPKGINIRTTEMIQFSRGVVFLLIIFPKS